MTGGTLCPQFWSKEEGEGEEEEEEEEGGVCVCVCAACSPAVQILLECFLSSRKKQQ